MINRPLPALLLSLTLLASSARAAAPDFAAAHQEVIEHLKQFVSIDTSNPPGNETKAAEFLKAFLDKEGIPSEIVALDPKRGSLIARLKGSGKKQPILLLGHTDVVGVEREKWDTDPFVPVIKDGWLYARGAADDKCMTTVCLEIMLLLKRSNVALDRDVIFVAEAGEEGTSQFGIDFLVEKHWDKIACEYALNEGGALLEDEGEVRYLNVATTEKVPRTIFLSAKGVSGHASRPRPDNPIAHLATAIAKISEWQPPLRLNDTTRAYFQRLATISPPEEAWMFTHFDDPVVGPQVQEIFRKAEKYLGFNSTLRTSISPTVIKGGFRTNVIPGDALATLDVRALPDEDMDAFVKTLEHLINDPAVSVTRAGGLERPTSPPSRLDNEMFRALERAQAALYPNAVTIPSMSVGATDSAQLRAKGVQAYGLGTVSGLSGGGSRAHGNNERVNLAGIRPFIELMYRAVTDVAAAK